MAPVPPHPGSAESAPDVERAAAALAGALPAGVVGVVLGSGLGGVREVLEDGTSVPYTEVPGFPVCRVSGHAGVLHAGRVGDRAVVLFEGRVHLYEGAGPAGVCFAVRLLSRIGAAAVVLSAAAGAVNPAFAAGELMLVTDHLNLTGEDPLRERIAAGAPPVFFSQSRVYDPLLLERLSGIAFDLGGGCRRGVLAGVRGPSYETPAEVRALRALGADAVTMSTVLEAMAAAASGLPVAAFAVITNQAGEAGGSHEAVLAAAGAGAERLRRLLAVALEDPAFDAREAGGLD